MSLRVRLFNTPVRIFVLAMLLSGLGLVMVYSSSASYAAGRRRTAIARAHGQEMLMDDHSYHESYFVERQFAWLCIGLIALFCMYRLDYRLLKDTGPYLLVLSFVLLVLVFVPGIGRVINDHRRWIGYGPFTFQPSELAKLALIIYMARMLTNQHDKIKSLVHGVLPALGLTLLFVLVIVIEPDIGAALVTMSIILCMWFIAGMRILHLGGLVATGIPPFLVVLYMFPDRVERIFAFVHLLFAENPSPEATLGRGFQLMQSLIAIGSGGLTGVGLGNSMQKYFLTEQFSDFIFAIICEELGFIGGAFVILCFFLLIWEGWRIALRAPDYYATLLASGITLMLTISVGLNLMVVTGLAPTKGLALPLVSYGGSSMMVTLASIGILMNIGKYVELQRQAMRARPGTRTPRRRIDRSR